ncbi:MAG TPA: CAP domain-containing protein [Lapillicoccus sp.]|jgi:uncharacterized protein YkwD|nr:CAP domain-containing protein [Lapillicoccus sp.]
MSRRTGSFAVGAGAVVLLIGSLAACRNTASEAASPDRAAVTASARATTTTSAPLASTSSTEPTPTGTTSPSATTTTTTPSARRTATPTRTPAPSTTASRSTPRPTATSAPTPPATPSPPPSTTGTATYEGQILALVNAERTAAGLPALTAQACPDEFAEPWSPHMAAEGGLSHQSLGPVLSRCGARAAAENVGMNSSSSPASMVAAFMNSPGHRANILGASYSGIGIGAYRDSGGVWWVTQDFVG